MLHKTKEACSMPCWIHQYTNYQNRLYIHMYMPISNLHTDAIVIQTYAFKKKVLKYKFPETAENACMCQYYSAYHRGLPEIVRTTPWV